MLKPISIIFLCLLFFINCDCNCESECENIACTEQFVMITIAIVDNNQNPFILDDFKVINIENDTDITNELNDYYQSFPGEGIYPIFDDRFQNEYQNQEIEIQFIGYIDSQEIINESYSVGADCCHVYPISGNYNITVD